ncbi:hypothetical protein CAP38_05210 [Hydrogenophaga sp. IBVHS2]|nr:hypothetical protein CAP38_05210 [Hydrogenophaga sp. IBVHS2]
MPPPELLPDPPEPPEPPPDPPPEPPFLASAMPDPRDRTSTVMRVPSRGRRDVFMEGSLC